MERAEWLKQMRQISESLYDRISPGYWTAFGLYENNSHKEYLQKFLASIPRGGTVLSAACGAGRYDGLLLDAGCEVIGIDQSVGMLARARGRFPGVRYEQVALEAMDFESAFDGAICMDAMEHVCPEDWPLILQSFRKGLRPRGLLYFTVEIPDAEELRLSFERARSMGLPVVFGELADQVVEAYGQVRALTPPITPSDLPGGAVYHYYPSLDQVAIWLGQAGLTIEDQGTGSGYSHIIARKSR